MAYLVTLILCFACASQGQQSLNEDVDYQELIQAVLNAYDINRSFSENFYSLLDIICPMSVYCTGNNTGSEKDIRTVWDTVEEYANFSEDFISNYQPSIVPKARNFLKRNAYKLRGCCTICSCETECIERQNCCLAMGKMFQKTNDVEAESQVTQECVDASITSYLPAKHTERVGLSYFMVTACFLANVSEDIVIKCRQPDPQVQEETRPVYSPSTRRIYKNKYCAACNDDNEVTLWTAIITIHEKLTLTGEIVLPSTPEEMYAHVLLYPRFFNLYFIPSSNMPMDTNTFDCIIPEPEPFSDSVCKENKVFDYDQKYLFTRACAFQQSHYHTRRTYMNAFCFLCEKKIFKTEKSEKCNALFKDYDLSFSALLVSNQAEPGLEAEKDNPCKCTEYFDKKKKICRMLECPPGEMFVDCACNAFLQNINRMPVKVYLEVTPEQPGRVAEETIGTKPDKNIVKSIIQTVKGLLDTRFGPLETKYSFLFREMSASNRSYFKLSNVITTSFKSPTDDREKMKSMFKILHSGLSTRILGIPMKVSLGRIFNIKYSGATLSAYIDPAEKSDVVFEHLVRAESDLKSFTNNAIRFTQTLNKLVYCKRVKLAEDEVDLLQNNSAALGLSQSYLSYVFWKEDGSMCLDDFENAFLPDVTSGKYFCNTNTELALFTTWISWNLWYM